LARRAADIALTTGTDAGGVEQQASFDDASAPPAAMPAIIRWRWLGGGVLKGKCGIVVLIGNRYIYTNIA